MTESKSIEFITKKHKRLFRYATIAIVFAWMVLVFHVLQVILIFGDPQGPFVSKLLSGSYNNDFATLFQYPLDNLRFLVEYLSILVRGVVLWLTLKGISMGLNMIAETDLNYRDRRIGDNDER